MDILLTAIDLAEVDFLERLCEDHQLRRVPTSAFADDMLAMVANLRNIRRVADVVCAFCLVFGFDIRGDKLRAF